MSYPYLSKDEKKIPINDPTGKWSDLTLMPEWQEKYYDVYSVRKFGKWIMIKALKKEYADKPEYREMLEKEFDTRYNLAHPNIVMVNDLEEVPGVGMSIVTDDVYGYSLRRLIDEKRLTPRIVQRLQTQLPDAMEYIQENHLVHYPITPETIIFTEYNENLKLLNVGYDQTDSLSEQDTSEDIRHYGEVIMEVLPNLPASLPHLKKIAENCIQAKSPYKTVTDLQLALQRRSTNAIYIFLCLFITVMAALLIWLSFR